MIQKGVGDKLQQDQYIKYRINKLLDKIREIRSQANALCDCQSHAPLINMHAAPSVGENLYCRYWLQKHIYS